MLKKLALRLAILFSYLSATAQEKKTADVKKDSVIVEKIYQQTKKSETINDTLRSVGVKLDYLKKELEKQNPK